jgi:hypothetical protein
MNGYNTRRFKVMLVNMKGGPKSAEEMNLGSKHPFSRCC